MASKQILAVREHQAQERVKRAAARAAAAGHQLPELQITKDAEYNRMSLWEYVAGVMETLYGIAEAPPAPEKHVPEIGPVGDEQAQQEPEPEPVKQPAVEPAVVKAVTQGKQAAEISAAEKAQGKGGKPAPKTKAHK